MKELSKVQDALAEFLKSKLPMDTVKDIAVFAIFLYPLFSLLIRMVSYDTFFYYVFNFLSPFTYLIALAAIVINFANKRTVVIGAYFVAMAGMNLIDVFRYSGIIMELPWIAVYALLAVLFFMCNSGIGKSAIDFQPVSYNPVQPKPMADKDYVWSQAHTQPQASAQPQQAPMQPQAPVGNVCAKCGAPLKPGGLFCGSCGTKVN